MIAYACKVATGSGNTHSNFHYPIRLELPFLYNRQVHSFFNFIRPINQTSTTFHRSSWATAFSALHLVYWIHNYKTLLKISRNIAAFVKRSIIATDLKSCSVPQIWIPIAKVVAWLSYTYWNLCQLFQTLSNNLSDFDTPRLIADAYKLIKHLVMRSRS